MSSYTVISVPPLEKYNHFFQNFIISFVTIRLQILWRNPKFLRIGVYMTEWEWVRHIQSSICTFVKLLDLHEIFNTITFCNLLLLVRLDTGDTKSLFNKILTSCLLSSVSYVARNQSIFSHISVHCRMFCGQDILFDQVFDIFRSYLSLWFVIDCTLSLA